MRCVDQVAGEGEAWAGGQQGHKNASSPEDEGNGVFRRTIGCFFPLVRKLPLQPAAVGNS